MNLNTQEKAIFKKAMEMMMKKVKKIADQESELIEDGKFERLLENCKGLLNKVLNYGSDVRVANSHYVSKITFFSRDYSEFGTSTSVRLPRLKYMLCTVPLLLEEIANPSLVGKSGMLMYEYFLSEQEYLQWLSSDDSVEPVIDYIFVE